MRYCKTCVQPDTRPDIYFNENGICGACLWEYEKKSINWLEREKELKEILEEAKKIKKGSYDCVVGVSGGKDSLYQAIYARDVLGLHPLLVNAQAEGMTEIGEYNIENLKQLGFDVIVIRPNPVVMKKMIIHDFFKYLNVQKAIEYSLWASAYIIADKFDIPLIIQGEDASETLGVIKPVPMDGNAINADQLNTIRVPAVELYKDIGVSSDDLFLYRYDKENLVKKGIRGLWLSHYSKEWGQPHNAEFSLKRGLKIRHESTNPYSIGNYRLYSQLDSKFIEINQMFKYVKFGFGQATDHACYDIRDGFITRQEGIYLVKEFDGLCGEYFILDFCRYIGIDKNEFWEHVNRFRGPMWKEISGEWVLDNPIWKQESILPEISFREIKKKLPQQ